MSEFVLIDARIPMIHVMGEPKLLKLDDSNHGGKDVVTLIDLDEVVALLPPEDVPKIMVTVAAAYAAGMGQSFRVIGVSIIIDL